MITYINKGHWLHDEISSQGESLVNKNGVYISSDDTAVQAIIDTFDPLPFAQAEAVALIDAAAEETRMRYVTPGAGQAGTYEIKRTQAQAFKDAGYPEVDIADYPMIYAESQAIASTGQVAADLILNTANQWIALAAFIEQTRRTANEQIKAEADWQQCGTIAATAVATLEAI